ncbi:MAG TPA: helix-turn-helix transcriptional regulator [Baekduia sp.]
MIEHHAAPDGTWAMAERRPHPALAPLVARGYTGYRETAAPPRRLEVPNAAIVVILNLGPPLAVDDSGPLGSFVAGLYDRAVVTHQPGEQAGIQFDLTPLGARTLLGLPMRELARQVVALEDVIPGPLVERLREARGWAARFDLLDAFLLDRLARATAPRPDVAFAWSRLVATHGAVGVGELCAELRCSRRHLSGRFAQDVGLGPKAVARILRFQRVLALLGAPDGSGRARFAEIAAAGGYYDQPHLNRDFRELAGCTPTEYLALVLPEGRGVTPPADFPNLQDAAPRAA